MNTIEKLNKISELQAAQDAALLRKAEKLAELEAQIPAEIRVAMRAADDAAAEVAERTSREIEELKAEVKADVIAASLTVKGDFLEARFVKGRVTWDSAKLEGFAASHPEILPFRKQGDPSVSFYDKK